MNDALKIEKIDNVAVVIRPVTKGETVVCSDHEGETITVCAASDIPIYHKIALQDIAGSKDRQIWRTHRRSLASDPYRRACTHP